RAGSQALCLHRACRLWVKLRYLRLEIWNGPLSANVAARSFLNSELWGEQTPDASTRTAQVRAFVSDFQQLLLALFRSNRDDEAATDRELLLQSRRHIGPASRHKNGIEWCGLWPTQGAARALCGGHGISRT